MTADTNDRADDQGTWVDEFDPRYPIATKLKTGAISLAFTIGDDDDILELSEDVDLLVRRFLRSRGCIVYGWSDEHKGRTIELGYEDVVHDEPDSLALVTDVDAAVRLYLRERGRSVVGGHARYVPMRVRIEVL